MANTLISDSLEKVKTDAQKLQERYDGDNDIIVGAPLVTYTDMELLNMVIRLTRIVAILHEEIDNLRKVA